MDDLLKYMTPAVTAVGGIFWLARLELTGKTNRETLNKLRSEIDAVRAEQAEINRRAQDQAIMLARIDESLASIKITLDRLYERTAGKV